MPRVVSLIASGTEIVCALGLEDALVGRSHECDWPPGVRRLPAVNRPGFATAGSSRAVDLALKDRLRKALSIYEVGAELLRRLQPDLIITQTQCEVCAVSPADGTNFFGEARRHSPWMTWDALAAADPDVILVSPCGFDIARTRSEMHALAARPGWPALSAVTSGRVYLADGNAYFHRPGPRLVESLEILAEIVHPAAFCFGHEGRGWVPFEGKRAA